VPGASGSPAPKMRTSADRSQAETASLESCCSASSAHGTARTEAQRLGLLACIATLNVKRSFMIPCRASPTALLPKCERLLIAYSQKTLAWKAVAQPHLPMALLAQRQRDWVCLLVLPPQNSNLTFGDPCRAPPAALLSKMRKSADSSQAERASLECCCSVSSAHGTARTEAQRLGLACLFCHLKLQM